MTSNLGAALIMEKTKNITPENKNSTHAEIKVEIEKLLKQSFQPEFLNRIDETIVFHALTKENLKEIVRLQFHQIQKMMANKEISLTLSDEAASYLADVGYDPAFGARPLKRTLQKLVANPLATKLLNGDFQKGDKVEIHFDKNFLAFNRKSS